MNIRPDQMAVFENAAEERFMDRLLHHLREHHGNAIVELPDERIQALQDLPEPALRKLVRRGVARARAFGLTLETTITGFVAIMFEVSPNFDQMPSALLARQARLDTSDARLNLLLATASSDEWESAGLAYDPMAW